jgi:hypothetical protein
MTLLSLSHSILAPFSAESTSSTPNTVGGIGVDIINYAF